MNIEQMNCAYEKENNNRGYYFFISGKIRIYFPTLRHDFHLENRKTTRSGVLSVEFMLDMYICLHFFSKMSALIIFDVICMTAMDT